MKSRNQKLAQIIAAAIGLSLLTAACAGSRPAVNWTFWRDLKVMAKNSTDHLSIAASYRQSARDYRQIAQEHERMKTEYAEYGDGEAEVMQAHCDKLIEKHRSLAEELDAMAREHEKLAVQKRENSFPRTEIEPSYGQSKGLKVLEF